MSTTTAGRITSVLVPVDPEDGDGRAAETALEVASELALRAGLGVTLVAVDPPRQRPRGHRWRHGIRRSGHDRA